MPPKVAAKPPANKPPANKPAEKVTAPETVKQPGAEVTTKTSGGWGWNSRTAKAGGVAVAIVAGLGLVTGLALLPGQAVGAVADLLFGFLPEEYRDGACYACCSCSSWGTCSLLCCFAIMMAMKAAKGGGGGNN